MEGLCQLAPVPLLISTRKLGGEEVAVILCELPAWETPAPLCWSDAGSSSTETVLNKRWRKSSERQRIFVYFCYRPVQRDVALLC